MTDEHRPLDGALDAAWRAHVREAPPAALDDAILAAAHRAVASGPRIAERRAPRWTAWAPLAVAATIGVIAFGVLQLAPRDEDATRTVVAGTPVASVREPAAAHRPAQPAEAERRSAPATAAPPTQPATAALPTQPAAAAPPTQPATAAPPAQPAVEPKRTEPVDTLRKRAEAPKPRTDRPRLQQAPAVDRVDSVGALERQIAAPPGERVAAARPAAPASAPAPREDKLARPDMAADANVAPPGAAKAAREPQPFPAAPSVSGAASGYAPAPPAASAGAARAMPAPPSGTSAMKEETGGASAASGAMRDRAEANSEMRAKVATARAPDDYVRDIRRLRSEGRDADAALALAAFRAAYPDADERLPQELRAWARSVVRP